MKTSKFIPKSSAQRREFLRAMRQNLPDAARRYNLDPQELQEIDQDAEKSIQNIDDVNQRELDLAASIQKRNDEWEIFNPKLIAFIQRLRAHRNYSKASGEQMGLVEDSVSTTTKSTAKEKGIKVEIYSSNKKVYFSFQKARGCAIAIYAKRGSEENFSLLDKITGSKYEDTRPNIGGIDAERREYQFSLFKNDEEGRLSPIYPIGVLQ
jgi:hypothetical protein